MRSLQRILQVEDDPDVQLLTRMALKRSGVTLAICATGAEALQTAPEFGPDLVLLDLQLPDIGGLELLQQLRQQATLETLPGIVLSASLTVPETAGLLGTLKKPFNPTTLAEQILALWASG